MTEVDLLLFREGQAVGTLVFRRVTFVSANENTVERAIVFAARMVAAATYGALNASVAFVFHVISSRS